MRARAGEGAAYLNRRRLGSVLLFLLGGGAFAACGGETPRANPDLGVDAGPTDAGHDAGDDAGYDAGYDAGVDAGPIVPCANLPGLYAPGSCTTLSSGVMPYAPRFTLWTDGAAKERFIYLPAGSTIDGTDPDAWIYPVGTTLWKHFSYGGMRVETRMLRKVSSGVGMSAWEMRTFQWNDTQDDVTEVTLGADNVLGTNHDIPAQALCAECHRSKDAVLGFSAIQLGSDVATVGVPLTWLMSSNTLTNLPSTFTADQAAIPGNPIEVAALGYLHANCGHCHLGVGGVLAVSGTQRLWVPVGIATVPETPTYIDTVGVSTSIWMAGGAIQRIASHSPATSAVHLRMNTRISINQMPPLATEQIDVAGLGIVDAWINSLP